MTMQLASARSLLFVPAARADRFAKAQSAGADLVCIDLEDATAVASKDRARVQTLEFLAQQQRLDCWLVRINCLRSADGLRDLLALKASGLAVSVALAKVESAAELEIARSILGPAVAFVALLESVHGVERAFEIAAHPGCMALMLGAADYCAQLGARPLRESLSYPRSRLLAAAASRGLGAIDVPHFEFTDDVGLCEETRHSLALGFSCKSAIHPRQIALIHAVMQPGAEEIQRAQALIRAFSHSGESAIAFEGKMIDRPIVSAAERILARARVTPDLISDRTI